jgi:HlyD family secretion protein
MSNRTEFSFQPGQPTIALSRVFEAPHRRVFEAWTQPEQVRRWYNLQGLKLSECEIDLQAGGKWRLVFSGPQGRAHSISGVYHEVAPPHRLVHSYWHDDAPHFEATETLEFRENGESTLLTSTLLHKSVESRDAHVRSGMQDRAAQILDSLAEHIESRATDADGAQAEGAAAADAPRQEPARSLSRKTQIPWRSLSAALLVFFLAGGALYGSLSRRAAAGYVTQVVERGPVSRIVAVTGTVEGGEAVQVRAAVSGVIAALYCDVGAKVEAGRLCVQIDARPYQNMIERNKAELAAAERRLEADDARLNSAKAVLERSQDSARQGAATRKTHVGSVSGVAREEERVRRDRREIDRLRAALEAAEDGVRRSRIVAPIDGMVTSRSVAIGQTVKRENETPILTIAPDLTLARVAAHVNAGEMDEMKVGDKASLVADNLPARVFAGEISHVGREGAGQGKVVVSVPNPDLSLAPGMKTTVQIVAAQRDDVIRVPDRALRYSSGPQGARGQAAAPPPGWARLKVLRNDRPESVLVKLGLDDGDYTEIAEGELRLGDKLIVAEHSGN